MSSVTRTFGVDVDPRYITPVVPVSHRTQANIGEVEREKRTDRHDHASVTAILSEQEVRRCIKCECINY